MSEEIKSVDVRDDWTILVNGKPARNLFVAMEARDWLEHALDAAVDRAGRVEDHKSMGIGCHNDEDCPECAEHEAARTKRIAALAQSLPAPGE